MDSAAGFAAVVLMAGLLALFTIGEGGRVLARRFRRWLARRREYRKYRARARQYVTRATAIEADVDWQLVNRLRREFPTLTEDELYAAAFERIRDSERRDLTPARMTRVFAYCRASFVEVAAPIAQTPKAS